MKSLCLIVALLMLASGNINCIAQCKEKIGKSNNKIVRYHTIPLTQTSEYLTLSKTGDEKLFTYHNELIELVFHVPMFTEIKFISSSGNFSLFTTSSDRSHFNKSFTLSCPVTASELEKMKGTTRIEILFPEEQKIFKFSQHTQNLMIQALSCVFR